RGLFAPIDTPDEAALLASAKLSGHVVDCSGPNAHAVAEGGFEIVTVSGTGCGDDIVRHVVRVASDGTVTVTEDALIKKGDPHCAIGRRPEGLRALEAANDEGLGALFARIARLEAASVPAFRRLARELRAYGAPRSLVDACRTAARDEIRHARVMRALARAHGAEPQPVSIEATAARTLEAMAT